MKGSVKIMRSYDYNHFEVCLSTDEDLTLEQVDEMRKEAARLVDKAVKQYQAARRHQSFRINFCVERDAKTIMEKPESEWSPEDKATVKQYKDQVYWSEREYNYQDDWEEPEYD